MKKKTTQPIKQKTHKLEQQLKTYRRRNKELSDEVYDLKSELDQSARADLSNACGIHSDLITNIEKCLASIGYQNRHPKQIAVSQDGLNGRFLQTLGEHPHFKGIVVNFVRELKPGTFLILTTT